MKALVLSLLLSLPVYAGTYAGINIGHDNNRGFCEYSSVDDYCTTARAFLGYDARLSESVYFDAFVSYEEQIDGDTAYNPTAASITIMKRF